MLVKQVLPHGPLGCRSQAGQTAHIIAELLDDIMAVRQEVLLQEVTQMRIGVAVGHVVQLQQGLVERFLVLQRESHCIQSSLPVLPAGFRNSLQQNSTTSHVLVSQQAFCLLPLLHRTFEEIT
uniref:Uncharacterized protein n=1 Tax=Anguilla anguilla TaxID=7936 RepID=A0A0E9XC82_ANGAN